MLRGYLRLSGLARDCELLLVDPFRWASRTTKESQRAYFDIYRGLLQAKVDFVVIGGQACNIWALLYEDSELAKERPYTSTDVDVYSKRQADLIAASEQFQVEPILNTPDSAAPVMGYLVLDKDESQILLQFLNNAWGIKKAEKIATSAQAVEFPTPNGTLTIKVMHPVLVLQSKVAMAGKRGAKLQQDLKHVRMALLFAQAFISETAKTDAREAIKLCKAVLEIAESTDGLELFGRFSLAAESALPAQHSEMNPKLARFLNTAAAARLTRLHTRRKRN